MRKSIWISILASLALASVTLASAPATLEASHLAREGQSPTAAVPEGGVYFVLDDGTWENSIGLSGDGFNSAAVWLNRFSPAEFPVAIDYVEVMWPDAASSTINLVSAPVTILLYADPDGDGNPDNATLVYQETFAIGFQDGLTFETYDLSGNPEFAGGGDVYIGFRDDFNLGGTTPTNHAAALDQTASQGRSWVGGVGPGGIDPDINNLANNSLRGYIDSFGFPGNWMIRAVSAPTAITPLQAVPALQPFGLAALALLLLALAIVALRRRRA